MAESTVTAIDGSLDWSGGINSLSVTTIQSDTNPNGVARNQLCWLDNASVRDGGITQRAGWQPLGRIFGAAGLFQGGYLYQPDAANPYVIVSISGRIYKVDTEHFSVVDLSAVFGLTNPPTQEQAYFVQGEQFLIIQAGDGATLPLFWDGATLRRSTGLVGGELPAATAMDYYMGRIWYAQGRRYTAGDIVRGNGPAPYFGRDQILKVTENPMAVGGDGFLIPANDGIIRGIKHGAQIDAALGQGRLFIGTRKGVYALQVPVTRADWIASTTNNQPLQTVVQLVNGWVNDRSVVAVNGDLFYQSLEPGIRSLIQSVRYFNQWGNIQISANEQRILNFNDRSLLHAASGIQFQDRMWQTALPIRKPQGIVHQAIIPMDFIPISSFNKQREPNWEGMYEGLLVLQLFVGDFGGRERAFAVTVSQDPSTAGEIQLWELTSGDKFENGDNRVTWIIETPAFTWGKQFDLKKLVMAEIWADRLFGTVQFTLEYRPDSMACWLPWATWKKCSPKNSCENAVEPICYPLTPCLESYVSTMTTPKPPEHCAQAMGRPAYIGYQFQVRLIIHGFTRIRGIMLHAEKYPQKLYSNPVC